MDHAQIEQLLNSQAFPDRRPSKSRLVETHISYLILGYDTVYKIKKPFQYSFLDFSTLAKRKYYCQEELRLNRRLAAQMYRQVVPVYQDAELQPFIPSQEDPPEGELIDYALEMKRMDSNLEMDKVLSRNEVKEEDVARIARKVAHFHESTDALYKGNDPENLKAKFRDIESIYDCLKTHLPAYAEKLPYLLQEADTYIDSMHDYLQERHDAGMIRDCHGDLHSKNIFLYEDPVIFDCIEFNEKFRHIDILNEIAFFCMDLEVNDAWHLSQHFYDTYQQEFDGGMPQDQRSEALFTFFKAYRANVRGKVIALKLMDDQDADQSAFKRSIREIQAYLDLMQKYLSN